ncbi:ferredoxin [Candidatus Woesearchaeota archaeon CG_4_10_14_0_2_um_filter_33_10]|nr:MAG: ferredoxin [Candidatus Woesearchaeota archaeon CG1_02_33_12]PIN78577.1 MAG: ferredoxin [Candidatus Woesearchaeota archaeon CG10_big_fil_rev_8_21_14_0_10_33_12]PIU72813.1 MAG: ferredoxin [Candidatus Woesearchaeota archaeon CG06_land_8_20_14_3_00_33_13]PIZ52364.1 MAG: ferredoxin [Candidatus Woesearchaeota archaeon CG_4_10_14_0_2_um_filter_33_10]
MKITINNKEIECQPNKTILEVAKENDIEIPTLCYQEGFEARAVCRICLVEVDNKLLPSCSTKAKEGMVISTESKKVLEARKINTELLMSKHIQSCFVESKEHELCKIAKNVGIRQAKFDSNKKTYIVDKGIAIVTDNNQCILCGRCVQACQMQNVNAIDFAYRSYHTKVTPAYENKLDDSVCVNCGQCLLACPVNAIYEKDDTKEVLKALKSKKHVIVQTAPAVRASLGEEFDLPAGTLVTGKMVSSLRKIGFKKIFDTQFGADLTIMEEAAELIKRLKENKNLPMITSCCPAWIKYIEHFYPEFLNHVSTCKSPHDMFGAIAKSYYKDKYKINKKDLVVVSVMPCTAKKFEIQRKEMKKEVDYVLTTRELARLIKIKKIDFNNLADEDFDAALGLSSGAGTIFGASGGVMEAALRTAYETATGKKLEMLEFNQIRGMSDFKEGSIIINGKTVNFAVVNGLHNAKEVLEQIKNKECKYDFIEVMACPGGCIAGGGQPIPTNKEIVEKRMQALYINDKNNTIRRSHENPAIIQLYEEFLGRPLSKKAEKLLHTNYIKRGI